MSLASARLTAYRGFAGSRAESRAGQSQATPLLRWVKFAGQEAERKKGESWREGEGGRGREGEGRIQGGLEGGRYYFI